LTTNNDPDDQTVETSLFSAMRKIRLISPDTQGLPGDYSRCGRTDRGVSALAQVVALPVRDRARMDLEAPGLDYCAMLNRVLPDDIIVTAWSPCSLEFDARFSCVARTYRYYIDLNECPNLVAMQEACALFEGTHDFRNLCKMDVENLTHFTRRVESCKLVIGSSSYCEIKGNAFLWHQIRMMMAILFLVANNLEQPAVVSRLLDITSTPRRPNYEMASEAPLILYATEFSEPLDWRISDEACAKVYANMTARHAKLKIAQGMCNDMVHALAKPVQVPLLTHASAPHVPLFNRPVGKSFEERLRDLGPAKQPRKKSREAVVVDEE
jgi:tRNA pseudouridine38/39 synthase